MRGPVQVEPITTALLVTVVSALTKAGSDVVTRRLTEPRPVRPITAMDLSAGTAIRSRVSVRFHSIARETPYWVWFGVQRSDGWRVEIPALYHEPVDLVLQRGQYEMLALFLAKPASFNEKPLLMALGRHHDVIASAFQQELSITGFAPNDQQIALLRSSRFPDLPFRLPITTGELMNLISRSRQGSTALPTGARPPQTPNLRPRVRDLRRVRPALNPPAPPATWQRPVKWPRPATTITPQVPSASAVCKAQLRSGVPCTNPAGVSSGNLCQMHLDLLVAGKEVRWHRTGERIRLACHAKLASGTRCKKSIVRDNLCGDHLAQVAAGKAVLWFASGKRVRLACGARTKSGARCRRDPVRKGLCRVHWDKLKTGESLVWHETGTRIRIAGS